MGAYQIQSPMYDVISRHWGNFATQLIEQAKLRQQLYAQMLSKAEELRAQGKDRPAMNLEIYAQSLMPESQRVYDNTGKYTIGSPFGGNQTSPIYSNTQAMANYLSLARMLGLTPQMLPQYVPGENPNATVLRGLLSPDFAKSEAARADWMKNVATMNSMVGGPMPQFMANSIYGSQVLKAKQAAIDQDKYKYLYEGQIAPPPPAETQSQTPDAEALKDYQDEQWNGYVRKNSGSK